MEKYLYLGLCNFYLQDYEKASDYFIKAKQEKYKSHNSEYFEDEGVANLIEMEGDDENEENTGMSFTKAEICYNIAQAFIMQGNVTKAIEFLSELLEMPRYKQKVEDYMLLLKEENPSKELTSGTHMIEVFSAVNRLCGIYEDVTVT